MPYDENDEFYWEPMRDATAKVPSRSRKRTNLPLLRHRMDDEQRAGFALAMKYGAQKTALTIRVGKVSLGQAIVSACREIGTEFVVNAFEEARNPEWSLCAIRYAPGITQTQRELLVCILTDRWFDQAEWSLKNMTSLSSDEKKILAWVTQQR